MEKVSSKDYSLLQLECTYGCTHGCIHTYSGQDGRIDLFPSLSDFHLKMQTVLGVKKCSI